MTKDILVVGDPHANPDFPNDRADWLGQYIKETKPDVVVNMGDTFDMPSLSSYDKGKASFHGASYERDIESGLDFLDRMWHPVKKSKKKLPYSVFLVGNHEQRKKKVLEYQPELAGDRYGVSYKNYQLSDYHNEVVYYEGQTPGIYTIEGISFAHYMVSGLMGRPIGGEHHASSLLAKNHCSCVVGHSHTVDWSVRSSPTGNRIMGLVAGVYQDYDSPWAGNISHLWWRGIVHLRNVEDGEFDPEFVSLGALRRQYGAS
jgi:hypothetical protein